MKPTLRSRTQKRGANKHEYNYNAANQRINSTNLVGTFYTNSYDRIGQLKIADSSANTEDRRYVYDAAWNLNFRTNNTTAHTFKVDNLNQLTNATGVGKQTYDANGNLTLASSTGAADWVDTECVYDDENRLVNWYNYHDTYAGSGVPTGSADDRRTEFVYDGRGRLRKRIEYISSGSSWAVSSETRYLYDGMRVIQERSSANTPTVSYTRGNDLSGSLEGAGGIGGLLGRSHGYSAGNWSTHSFYHADGNGNVTYLLNSSQSKVAEYRYDPFGNTISASGSLSAANVYRFSSKEVHLMSGMYYYGYRFYDPNLQRWPNKDPIGEVDGPNLYAFVANSPISRYDAVGLFGCSRDPCSDPCGDAKRAGQDNGDVAGIVCCGGKAYSCVWKSGGATGAGNKKAKGILDKCSKAHEDTHIPDTVCPPGNKLTRGGPAPGTGTKAGECAAYKVEVACLKSSISGCDGDPQCISQVIAEIKWDKQQMQQLGCPP